MRKTGQLIHIVRHDEPLKERKVAILGKAPSSLQEAPFDDPSWECWTINNAAQMGVVPRWDRQFELHPIEWTKRPEYNGYYNWLCQQKEKPVYVREPTPEIPSHVVYPHAEIVKAFGTRYFTNSISWMLALAIAEGCSEIGLWGVDMAMHAVGLKESEYASQRPSCEFFIGVAAGLGIKVHIPASSDLMKAAFMYGVEAEQADDFRRKVDVREKEIRQRIAQEEQTEEKAAHAKVYLSGALDDMQYFKQWIQ
jgi:hypothetical protein